MSIKLNVLAFGAHPDDVELGVGGILAKEVALGKMVGVIDLTKGELGTRGTPEARLKEADAASKILGLQVRENMMFRDGFFKNDEDHQLRIISKIREYKPEVVLTCAPQDRHPDHARASQLVVDACFISGLRKVVTSSENGKRQEPWRPSRIYKYIQFWNIEPDLIVDISGFIAKKVQAVMAYETQFFTPSRYNSKDEFQTVISTKEFMESVEYRAKDFGRLVGVSHGEGLISVGKLLVKSLESIS